jgi:hypothetical protein
MPGFEEPAVRPAPCNWWAPGPAGRLAGAVTRSGRQICQRRSRCRTYAGSSAARIYGRHADCRIHAGRHSCRPRSGTYDYRPAASGLRVRKLRHLRCRQCRAIESTAVGTFRHGDGRRRFFRCSFGKILKTIFMMCLVRVLKRERCQKP